MPRILFIGDPHGDFRLVKEHGPWADAIVLLGDLCCERPLKVELGRHTDKTWFIPGNHDSDEARWLMATWDLAERNLHAKIMDICSLRVAGLGGVFRGQVWMPAHEGQPEELRWRTRADYLAATNPKRQWMGGPPIKHWCMIWPEDVEQLLDQGPADILVTHEAPESHRHGFRVLGDLARVMDVRLVVHGHHHHEEGEAVIEGGVRVRQVGLRGLEGPEGALDGYWWLETCDFDDRESSYRGWLLSLTAVKGGGERSTEMQSSMTEAVLLPFFWGPGGMPRPTAFAESVVGTLPAGECFGLLGKGSSTARRRTSSCKVGRLDIWPTKREDFL